MTRADKLVAAERHGVLALGVGVDEGRRDSVGDSGNKDEALACERDGAAAIATGEVDDNDSGKTYSAAEDCARSEPFLPEHERCHQHAEKRVHSVDD